MLVLIVLLHRSGEYHRPVSQCSSKSGETAVPEDIGAPRMMKKSEIQGIEVETTKDIAE